MKVLIRVTERDRLFEGEVVLKQVNPADAGMDRGKDDTHAETTRPTKPSEAVQALYERGFFDSKRTLAEVLNELSKDGYNDNAPSVSMALGSKQFLQRSGVKGSYRFVQKYPPSK